MNTVDLLKELLEVTSMQQTQLDLLGKSVFDLQKSVQDLTRRKGVLYPIATVKPNKRSGQ